MKWPSWLRWRPKPVLQHSLTGCPQCGKEMIFIEKFTTMGDDRRTYRCDRCQKEYILDFGTALWKLMSDGGTHNPGQ